MNILRVINKFSQSFNYRLVEQGKGFDYQIKLYQGDQIKSFWHDIPIYPNPQNQNIINVGIEIPKDTIAKFELSKTIENNPIVQDTKFNKRTQQKDLRYYAQFAPYNYGFIPKTWENSTIQLHESFKGDDDPLDIIELSIQKNFVKGDIFQAKVLGAFCVLDQDEVDWKILVMNLEEADKYKINNFQDYEKINPDFRRYVLRRFQIIKTFDGKKENEILFQNQIFDVEKTIEIIQDGYKSYQELLKDPKLKQKRDEFKITQ